MNIKERTFWIIAIIALLFFAQDQSQRSANLNTLIKTYELESNIQHSQLIDVNHQINQASRLEYDRGFENGRTQAAIALMNEKALYDYADGYHAALTQFDPSNAESSNLDQDMLLDLLLLTLDAEGNSTDIYLEMISDLIAEKE